MSAEDDPPHAVVPPPAFLSMPAPAAVLAALPGARAVGGCVRDALAHRPVHDVDVAAPLPPEAMVPLLRRAGLKVFETGLAHGTVTAVLDGEPVEVTSLRRDVATDGRHADVAWTTDWREDAARRDFTVNAMSLAADGRLWDYFGGREDLAAGRVRFVGDPATRLREDYLRALRFFRFQARYGRGEPDAAALAAIRAAVPGLARLSAERVWMEIKRLLGGARPVRRGGADGRSGRAGRGAAGGDGTARAGAAGGARGRAGGPAAALRRPAARRRRIRRALAARLRMSGAEAATLAALRRPRTLARRRRRSSASRSSPRQATRRCSAGCCWPRRAAPRAISRPCVGASPRCRGRRSPCMGRDVLALGVQPGPEVGRLLDAVRAWWMERGCVDGAEACRGRLRELAAARPV